MELNDLNPSAVAKQYDSEENYLGDLPLQINLDGNFILSTKDLHHDVHHLIIEIFAKGNLVIKQNVSVQKSK